MEVTTSLIKSIMIKSILKSKAVKIGLLILAVLLVAGIVIPFAIKLFFMGLLFLMQKPITGLVIVAAFLLGMLISEKADKVDEFINNL
ncbi:hypothetical protein OAE73_00835 [bacterium]|nr:hypothetical protein [bacterium]